MESRLILVPDKSEFEIALSQHVRDCGRASKAANTQRVYESAWNEFTRFCSTRREQPFPASPATIVDYLTWLAESGKRVSTIETKLSALAFAHRAYRGENPTQSESVRVLMRGIRRKLGCAVRQKSPITREELRKMVGTLPENLAGKRDKAILLVGFAGAFRRSELVRMNIVDVRFNTNDMVITLRRTTTDQERKGTTKRIPRLHESELCPVRALEDWLDAANIQAGSIFRAIDRWGHASSEKLNDRAVALIVKRAAKTATLDAQQFAGHSLRSGFVTQAANDKTPEWAIAEVTGDKSQAILQQSIRDAGHGQLSAIKRALGEDDSKTE